MSYREGDVQMDKRCFAFLRVQVALAVALCVLFTLGQAFGKNGGSGSPPDRGKGKKLGHVDGRPAGWRKGKKEGWRTEFPPGWKNWNGAKRQQWEHGLGRAKKAVRKHAEDRLNAALRALEITARKGTPLDHAEKMAKAGLERGLGPFDFEPLGKFVAERVREGVKGEELSKIIHEEVNRRRQERERTREKLKKKRESGKKLKGNFLDKKGKKQEKGGRRHGRPHPKRERGKGKEVKQKKGGGKPN